jgi:N-acetylmuramoyl-L-alanine amidase
MLPRLNALWTQMPRWIAAIPAVSVIALAVWAGQGRATGAGVIKVRMGGDQTSTRVVIELQRSAHGTLISDEGLTKQVVVDLDGVSASDDLHGSGQGLVKRWSVDQAAGAARLELDLSKKAVVRRRFLLPPGDGIAVYRYVVDLEAEGASGALPSVQATAQRQAIEQRTLAPLPVAAAPLASRSSLAAAAPQTHPGKRIVVIDAGHGGHDPGAQGATRHEKDLTLAAAKALKTRLERTGRYRVVLTRASDVYIPLGTRVAIARHAGADLFISLHADSGSSPTIRGASVYTLSEHGVDRGARIAMRHDDWLRDGRPGSDPAVSRILLDLTQRDTTNRSAAFAHLVLERLGPRTDLLQRSHRDAGFAVLLAPDVPAVLLEMGFITNPDDEDELADPQKRAQLMDGVAQAVDDYFGVGGGGRQEMAALP